jgi:hypothetical protein
MVIDIQPLRGSESVRSDGGMRPEERANILWHISKTQLLKNGLLNCCIAMC